MRTYAYGMLAAELILIQAIFLTEMMATFIDAAAIKALNTVDEKYAKYEVSNSFLNAQSIEWRICLKSEQSVRWTPSEKNFERRPFRVRERDDNFWPVC